MKRHERRPPRPSGTVEAGDPDGQGPAGSRPPSAPPAPPPAADRGRALELFRQGRLPEAEAACRRDLARRPDDADALHLLGLIALQRHDHERAVVLVGKAIAASRTLRSVTLQGVPAPTAALLEQLVAAERTPFIGMVRDVNGRLRAAALAGGFGFLDVHAATANADGAANGAWHLDSYHLSPAFYRQAGDWLIRSDAR